MKKHLLAFVLAAFGVASSFAALPEGYTAVEYIESTRQQTINSVYTCGTKTRIEIDFTPLLTSSETAIFGTSWNGNCWLFLTRGSSFQVYASGQNLGSAVEGNDYFAVLQYSQGVVSNLTTGTVSSNSGYTMGTGQNIKLFGLSGGNMSKIRLRSMKIYEDGALVRDLRPCYTYVDEVKTAGLYDIVGEKFYTNNYASGVDFVTGPETSDMLFVKGDPANNEGVPTCGSLVGYGQRALTPGEAVIAEVDETFVEGEISDWTLLGWKLEQTDDNGTVVTTNTAATVSRCEFAHTGGQKVTLTWRWQKGQKTRLPSKYTGVEYIQSTGVQYLKNVYTANSKTHIETDFRLDASGTAAFYGGSWGRAWLLQLTGTINAYGHGEATVAANVGDTFHSIMEYSFLTVSNCTRNTSKTVTVSGGMGDNNTIGIFAVNDGGYKTKYSLYGMKIYEGDVLVRDFRPCYTNNADETKVAGLYDLVNGKFYTNAGTGADFVTGPETGDFLIVTGSPDEYGTLSGTVSAYGSKKLTDGESVTVSVSETTVETEARVCRLKGWVLKQTTEDGVVTETASTAANFDTCSYTHNKGDQDTLTWLWDVEYLPVLPDGYQTVEYIESTGTQRIPNVYGCGANTKVEMDFQLGSGAGVAIFGGSWRDAWMLQINGSFSMWGTGTWVGTGYVGDEYHGVFTSTWSVMTNLTKGTNSQGSYAQIASYAIALFGVNDDSTERKSRYKLYSAKIYEMTDLGDVIKRYFVPCVTNDGATTTAGLYDVVNGKFYKNADGGDDFTVGPVTGNYLNVNGEPGEYGDPVCGSLVGYGGRSLAGGEAVVATMPTTVTNTTTQRATLQGWSLAITLGGTVVSNATSTAATFDRCEFTHRKGTIATLTWRWKVENLATVTADQGLVVTADKDIVVSGDTLHVTVRGNGATFHSWSGDVDGLDVFETNLAIVASGPITLHAHAVCREINVTPQDDLQDAFDEATNAQYAVVNLAAGTYPLTNAVTIAHLDTPLRVYGSADAPTIFARTNNTIEARLLDFSGVTLTMDRLTVSNGYWNAATDGKIYGQGCRFTDGCNIRLTDCTFAKNGNGDVTLGSGWDATCVFGSAIGATGGVLEVVRGTFAKNSIHYGASVGGAIATVGTTVRLTDCDFTGNNVYISNSGRLGGGAIGVINADILEIAGCSFTSNWTKRAGSGSGQHGDDADHRTLGMYGGAVYASGCGTVAIRDTVFRSNWNPSVYTVLPYWPWGGCVYLENCDSSVTRTAFYDSGHSPHALSTDAGMYSAGGLDIRGGTLAMTNVLCAANYAGWCVGNNGGVLEAVNCTFAGAKANGNQSYRVHAAYAQYAGSATFRRCIFWDNAKGDTSVYNGSEPVFEDCLTGTDPLFADDVYCHPSSRAGSYKGGWFAGGSWSADAATSPAVDAGSDFAALATEPQPNGRRVNYGYDGNTEVASKSDLGDDPVVTPGELKIFSYANYAARLTGAIVYGDLADTGDGEATARVVLVWGKTDAGTAATNAWEHVVDCGAVAPWSFVTAEIAGDFTGKVYYRFVAFNSESETAWSSPARTYTMAAPPVMEYDTAAHPVSHLYRTSAKVRLNLTQTTDVATDVYVTYAPEGGEEKVTYAVRADPAATGRFTVDLTGLAPGTAYTFTATATNVVGGVTLDEKSFTTVADDETLALVAGPAASGLGDGSSWTDATTVDAALAAATKAGDTIKVLGGEYTLTDLAVANHPGLVLRGGYGSDGTPGAGTTVWSGSTLLAKRILRISASTVTIDGFTFTHGRSTEAYGQAVGAYDNSTLTVTNCLFVGNGDYNHTETTYYGGAIGAKGGRLTVTDCVFTNNSVHGGGNNVVATGGAIGASDSATVVVRRSSFARNYLQTIHQRNLFGGAIGCSGCASLTVEDCDFFRNGIYTWYGDYNGDWRYSNEFYGGAIYVSATPTILKDLIFDGNYCSSASSKLLQYWEFGGTCCFRNSKVSGVNLVIRNAGNTDRGDANWATGSIFVWGSSADVALTNVLNTGAVAGNLFAQDGGKLEVVNGTFADAKGGGKRKGAGFFQCTNGCASATATFKNCIFWNNADGFLGHTNENFTLDATYSDIEGDGVWSGTGNINADPKFVGEAKVKGDGAATFLSLQEKGYTIRTSSPCVNAGAPGGALVATDLAGNPRVRQNRVDMGAFEAERRGLLLIVK